MITNRLFDFRYDCIDLNSSAILILKNIRANTRFAPTSDAGFRALVGANLVFARSWNAKIRIAGNSFAYLTLIDDWYNNKVSLFWKLFFSDRLIKGHIQ
jgi:hypothetical protein